MEYILLIIIFILAAALFFLCREIQNVTKQIESLNSGQTKKPVSTSLAFSAVNKLCTAINISFSKAKNAQLEIKRNENTLKDNISSLSHDLRTPLTAILGYITLAKKNPEKTRDYLLIMEDKSNYLRDLINSFYDLSVIDSDDFNLVPERLNIVTEVSESLAGLYSVISGANCTPCINFPENNIYIMGDKLSLERIISNLVANAIKYASGEIRLSISCKSNFCALVIENDTEALQACDVDNVFNRFYTADKARTNKQTGLGLYIVKCLAEKMNATATASLKEKVFSIEICFPTVQ